MNNIALYLNLLREKRGLTIEQFVEDISSPRQFGRYVNEGASIPDAKLIKYIERLNISFTKFHNEYDNFKHRDNEILSEIAKHYTLLRYVDVLKILKNHTFTSRKHEKECNFYSIMSEIKLGTLSKLTAKESLLKLINHPAPLNADYLTSLELNCYFEVIFIETLENDYELFNTISNLIMNTKNSIEHSKKSIGVLTSLTQILGVVKDFERAFSLATKAIDIARELHSYHQLSTLYYFRALASLRLGYFELINSDLRKALNVLEIEENTEKAAIIKKDMLLEFSNHLDKSVLFHLEQQ